MIGPVWKAVAACVARATGEAFEVDDASPARGGCINQGFHLRGSGREFFAKLNVPSALRMLEAEAAGLKEMAATGTVRVPLPICAGGDRERAWLVLEYLPLSGGGPRAMALLGERL